MQKIKEGKNGFYCKDGLMSFASKYNILICMGGRYIGKSTEWQRFLIKEFIKKKKKFGIVKNTERALIEFAGDYWSPEWFAKWFPNFEFKYKKRKYFLRRKKEKQKENENWEECGYAFFLSRTSKKSTTTGQDIDYLLFEEFTNQEGSYLGSSANRELEPALLLSLYQTLNRGEKGKSTRNLKLIMLSNLYTIDNPYFTYFHILNLITNSKNSIYQRFYTYDKDKLHYVIEFPQLKPNEEIMAADENDEGIKFQDFRNNLKITKDRPNTIQFQLTFDNNYVINIANYNDSIIAFQNLKNTKCELKYSCYKYKQKDSVSISILKQSKLYNLLKTLFEANRIYYDKLETFIHLTNILAY